MKSWSVFEAMDGVLSPLRKPPTMGNRPRSEDQAARSLVECIIDEPQTANNLSIYQLDASSLLPF